MRHLPSLMSACLILVSCLVPVDASGREWQIGSKDVERLFESRLISRGEVGKLSEPKRQK